MLRTTSCARCPGQRDRPDGLLDRGPDASDGRAHRLPERRPPGWHRLPRAVAPWRPADRIWRPRTVAVTVRTRLADLNDPARLLRDGDAAYLPVGTKLHQLKGYLPRFRLSASNQGQLLLFEAFENPVATRGGDMLDIQRKVAAIEIDGIGQQNKQVGLIESSAEVDRLVGLILSAPVDRSKQPSGPAE